jgi:hypothetical protein
VIGMSVGDDGAWHRPPGIDVKVAARAVESISVRRKQ